MADIGWLLERQWNWIALEAARGTIAVVEDDASMRRGVERLLTAHGFLTEGHASAESFLNRVAVTAVDCLVVDINLGGMSGLELCRALRARGSKTALIFMTAVDDEDLEAAARGSDCVAYLRKPFAAGLLIGAVRTALAG